MARKLEKHGFDIDACAVRVRAELVSRGVDSARDEQTAIAKRFAARARELYGEQSTIENLCAEPIWVHWEREHDGDRLPPVKGCQTCALLYALWLPYKFASLRHDSRRLALAEASAEARRHVSKVLDLLGANPSAEGDIVVLLFVVERLKVLSTLNRRAEDPDVRQALRRGRRSNDLLRELERWFRDANFTDKQTAQLLLGNTESSTLQSIRDRRRASASDVSRSLEK